MITIAGASRYLNAATLANTKGAAAQAPNLLSQTSGGLDILEAGRQNSSGVGLSARARALTNSFINQSSSAFNQIHSLSTSANGSLFALEQTIKALRASLPSSQISEYALDFDEEEEVTVSGSSTGTVIDEEA